MKRIRFLLFSLLALPAVVSCVDDDAPSLAGIADREIALGLSLDNHASSRAGVSDGMLDGDNYIINGKLGIIMDLEEYKGGAHCCQFGISPLDNGRRGNIYLVTGQDTAKAPLRWSEVLELGVTSFDFVIDNINEPADKFTDTFIGKEWSKEEKKKYAAQREGYDPQTGEPTHTNDIIWGMGKAVYSNKGKDVSYAELTHRMTRVSVAFVDLTDQQQNDMTVSLSNIVCVSESFNRINGTVAIAENPERSKLELLKKGEKLSEIYDETADGTYIEHVTANYILPPQALVDNHWPEVVVTYTNEAGDPKEVRGKIPHDILNEDGNNWEGLNGLNAGNHLTIVARIDENIPDIVFTAKVRKWIDLGTKTVTANQGERERGIQSIEDLKRCIELYNELPQFVDLPNSWNPATREQRLKNLGELMQYGDCKDVSGVLSWTFYIDFELTTETLNALPKKFRYMLCGLLESDKSLGAYTYELEFVYKPDTTKNAVVKKELVGKKGIYNMEDLNTFIKAVNEGNGWFASFFADWSFENDNTLLKFPVYIRDSFSGNLIGKINKQALNNLNFEGTPIEIIFNANGFTVNGQKGDDIAKLIGL